jgi:fatty acid/phospholipid biosynthesis enzyme
MTNDVQKEKIIKAFDFILDAFKKLETELLAHQAVILALKTQISDLDQSLEFARKSPAVLQMIEKKYEQIRQSAHSQLDSMESVSQFFLEWNPAGPLN